VQARAALLPGVSSFNQFIYTQPNGTPSGAFVSNDGTHVYNNQAVVHGDISIWSSAPTTTRRRWPKPWRTPKRKSPPAAWSPP